MLNRTLKNLSRKLSILSFLVLFITPSVRAADVTLSWQKPDDDRVVGYNIYCGISGTDITSNPVETIYSADQTSCLLLGLTDGQLYDFSATSLDADGNESDFSEIISHQTSSTVSPDDIDDDGDGFTETQGDCNDNDMTIFPGALEICGDGLDQDCDGSDLACIDDDSDEDVDGDQLDDTWEVEYFGNIAVSDGSGDSDRDGYSDYFEFVNVTNPQDGTTEPGGNGYNDLTDDRLSFWSLDIDGDGEVNALTDGILIIRYLLGFSSGGATWVDGAIGSGASRASAGQIEEYIQTGYDLLDIDGNSEVNALTDGILIIRYLLGFSSGGDTWVDGAIGSGASRNTAEDIELYLTILI